MSHIISTFQLTGLHCESCKKISEKRVRRIAGVVDATTNLATGGLTISGDRAIAKEEVAKALEGTNYQIN